MSLHTPDIISESEIKKYLKTSVLGCDILVYDQLESTNKTAKELAVNGAKDGTLVVADSQTAGRGRLGRSFYSPAGSGIYMTLILKPRDDAKKALVITCATAVAVARAIENIFPLTAQIKWVNDIYVCGKKVCGILAEGGINADTGDLDYIALGIGINVSTESFPEDIRHIATSLSECPVNRSRIIAEVLNALEPLYLPLPDTSFMSEYRKKSLVLGKDVWVISGDSRYLAKVEDIDDCGHLLVLCENGDKKTVSTGEVSIRLA